MKCSNIPYSKSLEEFCLERTEESLNCRIVKAIPFAAHALRDAVTRKHRPIRPHLVLGGFNRSSQHWVVEPILGTRLRSQPVGVFQLSVLRGLLFKVLATA